jgi:O-succinylbenzoic acid--CoA ligase
MHLDNWLSQRAATCPDRCALIADGAELTYAELEREATAAARRLASKGARRGATVALVLSPGIDYVVLLHALMKLGAVAHPVNTRLSEAEQRAELDRVDPVLTVGASPDLGLTEADLPLLGEHDLEALHCRILTSGTTGGPRAVGLTYGNHLWSAVGSAFNLGIEPTDRWLCCLPLFHIGGLSIVMRSVIYGTTAVVHDGFDVDRVAASIEGHGVTVISVVATQLRRLLEAGVDLVALRAVLVGGGPVPQDVLEEAIERGATVVQTYGLTETASQVTTLSPADAARKVGSSGRPLLTTHLRIQDGEILVQGPTVAPGAGDEDGWLHTGDLGRIDDEGFLYVTDRLGDVIVTGGENVLPNEVEQVLMRHPAVADAAAVGRADPEWQEAVTAVVVLSDGADADAEELRSHCAQALARYKVPKRFEFVAELPRTASGKLLRRTLR